MNKMASTSNCAECCMHAASPFQVQEITFNKKQQQQQKEEPSIFGKLSYLYTLGEFKLASELIDIDTDHMMKNSSYKRQFKLL